MAEFLKSYGIWIFLGLVFLMMFIRRGRGHGMGCCGGDSHQHSEPNPGEVKKEDQNKHSGCC